MFSLGNCEQTPVWPTIKTGRRVWWVQCWKCGGGAHLGFCLYFLFFKKMAKCLADVKANDLDTAEVPALSTASHCQVGSWLPEVTLWGWAGGAGEGAAWPPTPSSLWVLSLGMELELVKRARRRLGRSGRRPEGPWIHGWAAVEPPRRDPIAKVRGGDTGRSGGPPACPGQ